MPRPDALTPLQINRIKPPTSGRNDYPDGATPGLCLRVSADGSKVWTLRMRDAAGSLRRFTLGHLTDAQGLKWARDEAHALRQKVRREGHDPHKERRDAMAAKAAEEARARLTLETLVDDWQRIQLATRSDRYKDEARRALKHAFASQWERPAEDLDRAAVVRALDSLARPAKAPKRKRGISGDGAAIADRTAAYGRACFTWAAKRGSVASNPFAALPLPPAPAARDRVLTDAELAAIWKATEAGTTAAPFGALVRMLILTGQRREEVAAMEWGEVADDLSAWTIPAGRTKNSRPHILPLPEMVRTILRAALPKDDGPREGLVFPGRVGTPFSGWSRCKFDLDDAANVTGWRVHDLRRTVATGLQRLGVRLEVTEAVLNHVSGSRAGIVGVYQRHDWKAEKADALARWAAHIAGILAEKQDGAEVIPLRRA